MMEELQLRNLSPITADTYIRAIERFAKYFKKSPAELGAEQVREYLLHLLREKKVVASTILVNRAALKFLYVAILKQKWFDEEIARPKRRPTLPGIASADEVTRILDHTQSHGLRG
jgi:site-specific recombinase XerD